eukprot:4224950-Prymnesium_polylepis.1
MSRVQLRAEHGFAGGRVAGLRAGMQQARRSERPLWLVSGESGRFGDGGLVRGEHILLPRRK